MNPFVYNSPVRGHDFFNREASIQKILRETVTGKSQGNIWITGERQIGKTSLLRRIQSLNGTYNETVIPYGTDKKLQVAFIFTNVQGCLTEDDFFNLLSQALIEHFDLKYKKAKIAYKNFIGALTEVYEKHNHYTVFLIDEFDAFVETLAYEVSQTATSFLAKLSSLLQEVDEIDEGVKTFSCVFTANHDMKELLNANKIDGRGSGLIVEALTLKWFTHAQVKALVKRYLHGNEVQFTDKEIDLCYGATHGYPYFTQKMLSMMFDAKKVITDEREYQVVVRNEFAEMFKETMEDWGGENMPQRTLRKLRDLVSEMEIGKNLSRALFALIEGYIKAKVMVI